MGSDPREAASRAAAYFLQLIRDGVPEVAAAEITAAWVSAQVMVEQESREETWKAKE